MQGSSRRVPASFAFAHRMPTRVLLPKVASRAAAAFVLLVIFVTGIATPTGVCAVLCANAGRGEEHRHGALSPATQVATHHHSGASHATPGTMTLAVVAHSYSPTCPRAERFAASRESLPPGKSGAASGALPEDAPEELTSNRAAMRLIDGASPGPPGSPGLSFSVLRI